jgi:hypothetical protein
MDIQKISGMLLHTPTHVHDMVLRHGCSFTLTSFSVYIFEIMALKIQNE